MGKRKSPHTEWVFEELDQLVLDKGAKLSDDERRRRWRALYEKTTSKGAWNVPLADARLVASLGWTIAMQDRDFRQAGQLARSIMAHPEMKPELLLTPDYSDLVTEEAVADILCGNTSEGVSKLSAHLRNAGKAPTLKHQVRNAVGALLSMEIDFTERAEPSIRELVVDILHAYPNKKRAARKAAEAQTYGELREVLYEAFGWPRPTKALVREARREDLAALAEFHYRVWRETYEGILAPWDLNGPTVQLREAQWKSFFDRNDPREFCFVLENEEGGLVGFAKGIPSDHPDFEGELSKLYIAREYRGYGFGRELIVLVARRMLELGMRSMVVFGDGRNPDVKLYEHLGAVKLDEDPALGNYGWHELLALVEE